MDYTELVLGLFFTLTAGGGLASIYNIFVRIKSGKQIDNKLSEIDIKQDRQLKELKADLLEQKKQIDNIIDFNNNAAYVLDLKILIMNKFIKLKHLNKETIQFLEYVQEGFIKFCENIIITRWNYDYIKLDKAWNLFYDQAKRPVSLRKLGIVAKTKKETEELQENFKLQMDKVILEDYPKNYFNEILPIAKMSNGERKKQFQEIVDKMIENLIIDIITIINKYKQY